ncbi:hypothetical protein SCUCBS95973_002738 [Sporothrix curviconia]|uniref:Rho-GAP domain-containing protein n=1 Tax=Sporothrix curviconia TaxID=1260050 RepID=A0ABP0B9S4_9PEZI
MPPSALPSRVVMEQPGPAAYSAWSRSSSDMHSGRPADPVPMGSSVPDRRMYRGSATSWTSTGSEPEDPFANSFGNAMELPRQSLLLQEYNRLAEKVGHDSETSDRRNWFARTFGKPSAPSSRRSSRHKRSDSDPTNPPQAAPYSSKSDVVDTLKSQSLQTLVRICGKSFLYLPSDYATRSLMLPTCFRAAAQYLVLNGPETRGIFRVSGSMRVVNELYDYYCINLDDDEDIAATVRSPNLPFHIKAGVHDVASMFKRLLAGLPGGILGHLRLFEALVEIRKMDGHASNEVLESGKSNPTQIKARLVALAIGSAPSPLQRELMCCVFGLLSLIGYAAETADPVQATHASSLPHSEMMGYTALGIIFGPLLMGDLLDAYSSENTSSGEPSIPASPSAGPSFQSTPSPQSKTDKRRKSMASEKHVLAALPSTLDKILLANDVAEMLIANWRAIVYEMKHMGIMRKESMLQHPHQHRSARPLSRSLRPTRSETFTDHDMGVIVQQKSQHYSISNLRKTRSASNTLSPNGTISSHQVPPNMPALNQRPADMSFEEFAARKKLRNYASNMSIASDSTYSAIEPQPVKPLSPPVEDPFYIPGPIAVSTRSGAAKLTKQRRVSGGLSSMFSSSDKSASPTKDLPKVSRKAVASHSSHVEVKSQAFGDSAGKAASPWNVPLGPAKVRPGTKHQVDDGTLPFRPAPMEKTLVRSQYQSHPPYSCKSEPAGRVGIGATVGATPQSKTAALIAKIMNTKQPTAEMSPAKMTSDLSSHKDKAPRPSPRALEPQFSQFSTGSPTKSTDKWAVRRKDAASAVASENRPADPPAIVSPTPQRPWKVRGSPLVSGSSPGPNAMGGNSPSATRRTITTTNGLERQPSLVRSNKKGNPHPTPQKKTFSGSPATASAKNRVAGLKSEEKPMRGVSRDQRDADQVLGDAVSPLSEIKNDARSLTRGNSASSRASKRTQTDGLDKMEAKSSAAGSSVKAMAAMFDTAAWKTTFDPSLPANTTPTATTKPQTPKRGSGLSLYTSNRSLSPSKPTTAEFQTPPHSPLPPVQQAPDNHEGSGTDASSLQRMASERRRHRLTKSEGRNGPLGKVGRLATSERRELTRSVDRSEAKEAKDDLARQKPLDRQTRGRDAGSPATTPAAGKFAKSMHSQDQPVPSRSTDQPIAALLPLGRSSSVKTKELRRLLDSKTAECESWKTRADVAEKRVAELELALAGVVSGSSCGRNSCLGSYDERKHGSVVTVTEQGNDQAWAWQNLLPETNSIHLSQEKLGMSSVIREIGVTGAVSPDRTVSSLRKDFETDNSNGNGIGSSNGSGYDPNATVVVRGKLMNKQLLPFSM